MTESPERPVHKMLTGLVPTELVRFLCGYTDILEAGGALLPDDQVPGSVARHGDPAFDTLLNQLVPVVSECTGRRVLPTYSFVRRYERGQELVPHTDRGACEFSLTINLASSNDAQPWPIWLRHGRQEPIEVVQVPGDALLYEGPVALHWRDPLVGAWHLQLFLHYVDADGPHADDALDRRAALGTSGRVR